MAPPDDIDYSHPVDVVEAYGSAETGDSTVPASGAEETSAVRVPSYLVAEKAAGTESVVAPSPKLPPYEAHIPSRSEDGSHKVGRNVGTRQLQSIPTPDGDAWNSTIKAI